MIVVHFVDARRPILALAHTIVQILGAGRPTPSVQAVTLEPTGRVRAGLGVAARLVRLTLVHIQLAIVTGPCGWAATLEPADQIDALATMFTRIAGAFVNVCVWIKDIRQRKSQRPVIMSFDSIQQAIDQSKGNIFERADKRHTIYIGIMKISNYMLLSENLVVYFDFDTKPSTFGFFQEIQK
jgi:hypothetical protein